MTISRSREKDLQKFSYIAGFMDGEGCILIPRRGEKFGTPRISMSQKFPEVLYYIREMLGYGRIVYRERTEPCRYGYSLRIDRPKDVETFLRSVGKYCYRKRDEVAVALSLFEDDTPENRERVYWELRRLKKWDPHIRKGTP